MDCHCPKAARTALSSAAVFVVEYASAARKKRMALLTGLTRFVCTSGSGGSRCQRNASPLVFPWSTNARAFRLNRSESASPKITAVQGTARNLHVHSHLLTDAGPTPVL